MPQGTGSRPAGPRPRVAEFFAGIGLVRMALEQEGFQVVFANDIEPDKLSLYSKNFDSADFVLGDIRQVRGGDVPNIELATASFPCTDVSLAGNRAGLRGKASGVFWEFARVLDEMGNRRPPAVLLENVTGFATSHNGADLRAALETLNRLGYRCDVFIVDARHFVPQSRPRLFIVCSQESLPEVSDWQPSELRPKIISDFVLCNPDLALQALPLELSASGRLSLDTVVERIDADDSRWWDHDRLWRFLESLSAIQETRLAALRGLEELTWRTAYRRTRQGRAVWEIRPDSISGCLRTSRGGSSKQALVEVGKGIVRARWMMPREYARLQGAPDFRLEGVTVNQALFGFGDAVCVPVVAWIARSYLAPLIDGRLTQSPTTEAMYA